MAHSVPYGCVASISQTSLQPTDPARIVRERLDHDIKFIPPCIVASREELLELELESEFGEEEEEEDDEEESL